MMQMFCSNCHLSLGPGLLLQHFFGWQCGGLQRVCLLEMVRKEPGGDVGLSVPVVLTRWTKVKCGQFDSSDSQM